jgi:hypothetical protein
MASHFVALSDLHLGYDNSVLNDSVAQVHLAITIAELCNGATDRLILNGDTFEGCVPRDPGATDASGFNPFMHICAQGFFNALLSHIAIKELIFVWGNHDYSLWKKLAHSCGVSMFTGHTKNDVLLQRSGSDHPGATTFLDALIGPQRDKLTTIRSAYPNYILGHDYPYLAFHHGHFLDNLVLGQDPEIEYVGLSALTGIGRPKVNVNGDETVWSLYDKTEAFVAATWEPNSRARTLEWAMMRRMQPKTTQCFYYPSSPAPSSQPVDLVEPFNNTLGKNALWYANLLMVDDTTPAPIGPIDSPAYLFLGHDHLGGFKDFTAMDNRPWRAVNTGGWTNDGGEPHVHGHATVWPENANGPLVHCVRV